MPVTDAPVGHGTRSRQAWSGRSFVVIGVLLGALGLTVIAFPLFGVLSAALSGTTLVQYANYMLQAQLIVHGILAVFLLVPAAFLIQQGRKRI